VKRTVLLLIVMLLALSMMLAACGGGAEEPTPEPVATEAPAAEPMEEPTEAPAAEAPAEEPTEEPMAEPTEEPREEPTEEAMEEPMMVDFAVLPGGFLEQALNGDFAGTSVTVDGPFVDTDEVKFNESMAEFEELTGIDVQYIGNKEFEASISIRVDAGDAPDIADFPQPGLMARFASQGKLIDPTTWIPEDFIKEQFNQSWIDMTTVPGLDGDPAIAGLFQRFNGKSLVWYPKAKFDEAGYEVPTTWEELQTLMDTIVADGDTPWCIGIGSGAATGWPATDWIEDFMLRTTSLENYDAWTKGELTFESPEVKNAAEMLAEIWFNDDYVFGGRDAIVSTNFDVSVGPMFEDPPKCWLHRQGNFITVFFPEGVEPGVDYDAFYLPPIDEEYGKPFLIAGDIMTMFNDRPEVRALMEYFMTPNSASGWLETGGAFATHLTATPDMYGSDLDRTIAQMVNDATAFRFDGSDLMPGEVGGGSFWKGMVDWVSGSADLDTVLAEIDASWPQ